jgi:hypothetical protein
MATSRSGSVVICWPRGGGALQPGVPPVSRVLGRYEPGGRYRHRTLSLLAADLKFSRYDDLLNRIGARRRPANHLVHGCERETGPPC